MSYIGNPIVSTDFPVDYFSGNGSTTAFTLSIAPASVNAVDVEVSGVSQSPQTYTLSGTTLTFSAAPPSGTNNIVIKHRGVAGVPNVPSAASVGTTSLIDASVTQAKLATGVVGKGPVLIAYGNTNQTISASTSTKVVINTASTDTASGLNTSTYQYIPNVAGYYQVNASIEYYAGGSAITSVLCQIYKNGSEVIRGSMGSGGGTWQEAYTTATGIVYLNGTTDYLELYAYGAGAASLTLYGASQYKFLHVVLVRAA